MLQILLSQATFKSMRVPVVFLQDLIVNDSFIELQRATYLTIFGAIVDIAVWTLQALSTIRKVKPLVAVLTLNLHNRWLSQGGLFLCNGRYSNLMDAAQ